MKANAKKLSCLMVLVFVAARVGFSQGFLNLDFESAKIVPDSASPYYPYGIAINNALPGWNSISDGVAGDITYNDPSIGSTWVTLLATNGSQIGGNYSVLLTGGLSSYPAIISQSALVPVGSESIFFEAQPGSSSLVVSLGGQDLSFSAIGTGSDYTLYGANISGFAGLTENLMFSATQVSSGLNNWNIDNIQFSPALVPEPSALGLAALGGLFFAWCRWKAPAI